MLKRRPFGDNIRHWLLGKGVWKRIVKNPENKQKFISC